MKLNCKWDHKMQFTAETGAHKILLDTKPPFGTDAAASPKQLLLAAISGCTGMDVIALLNKHKQPVESFQIEVSASLTEGSYPIIFKTIELLYQAKGPMVPEKLIESITLSQTKYCGVTAMVAQSVPITYRIELNGEIIGSGQAKFEKT